MRTLSRQQVTCGSGLVRLLLTVVSLLDLQESRALQEQAAREPQDLLEQAAREPQDLLELAAREPQDLLELAAREPRDPQE